MTREALVVSLLLGFAAAGCDDVPVTTSDNAGRVPSKPKNKAKEEVDDADKPPPKVDFGEAEFAESDKSRDPFRSFERQFLDEKQGNIPSQRKVILEEYTVDQLKLIGIITRVHPARAMLVDPSGIGHVIKRGQFIGKPEVVQTSKGVGASYEINWRVDRIRDGDIVLVREDPSNPDVPSMTRVVPLRSESDNELLEQIENSG